MRFRINSQEENCITPNISGVREKRFERKRIMARKKVVLLPSTEQALEKVGTNIKRARLRRNIRAQLLAEWAGISADTLSAIEKGVSTVSIGAYAAVLAVLKLDNDLETIALDEEGKQRFKEPSLKKRERATKKMRPSNTDSSGRNIL